MREPTEKRALRKSGSLKRLFPPLNLYEFVVLLFISRDMIQVALGLIVGGEAVPTNVSRAINIAVLAYVIYSIVMEHIKVDVVAVLSIYLFLLLLTVSITPSLSNLALSTIGPFVVCLEGFYLFARIRGRVSFEKIVPYCSLLLIPYCYLVLTATSINHNDNSNYFPIAYGIIVHVCLVFVYGYKNPLHIGTGLAGTIVILFAGARGAFACIIGAIALLAISIVLRSNGARRYIMVFGVLLVALILFELSGYIVDLLLSALPSSRTLAKMTAGNGEVFSGRDFLFDGFLNAILADPLAYRGILSDRILGATLLYSPIIQGTYAHNVVLEILYQHGVILGGVSLACFAHFFIKSCRLAVSENNRGDLRLLIVLSSCALVQLMFSSSYLICPHFWYLLGYMVCICSRSDAGLSRNVSLEASTTGKVLRPHALSNFPGSASVDYKDE